MAVIHHHIQGTESLYSLKAKNYTGCYRTYEGRKHVISQSTRKTKACTQTPKLWRGVIRATQRRHRRSQEAARKQKHRSGAQKPGNGQSCLSTNGVLGKGPAGPVSNRKSSFTTQMIWKQAAWDWAEKVWNEPQPGFNSQRIFVWALVYYLLTVWPQSNFSTSLWPTFFLCRVDGTIPGFPWELLWGQPNCIYPQAQCIQRH